MSKNIETILRSIDGLLGHHDLVDREGPLIREGPDPSDLEPYKAALDRLLSAADALRRADAKGQSATLAAMGLLIDSGSRQLVAVFTRWTKETSSSVDAGALVAAGKPFPPLSSFFLDTAIPLFMYLRSLPDIGPKVLKDLESGYADVRAVYMEESLRQCAKDFLVDALSQQISGERRGLGRLLDVLFSMAKAEYSLLIAVFPTRTAAERKAIYSAILPASLNLLYTTGQQLNTLIKQSLHSLVSIAFSTFAELQERVSEFEEWIRNKGGRKDNELGELLHAFRGSCLRSLPEFIDDTKAWGDKTVVHADFSAVGVNPMTVNVVTFMRQLSDNAPIVETFLGTLGAGNWGGPGNRALDLSETLIARYLNDVLATLLNALDGRTRSLRSRAGVSAIFFLNNISYIRREVLSSQIGDLLGEGCEDLLNKQTRSAKANYLDLYAPLISALLDAGSDTSGAVGAIKAGIGAVKGGGEKRENKDQFLKFQDALEEIESLHAGAKLSEEDSEMRERLKGEVERMVVPTYSKFLVRHNADFSKNPSKYLKLDAVQLTSRLAALFANDH